MRIKKTFSWAVAMLISALFLANGRVSSVAFAEASSNFSITSLSPDQLLSGAVNVGTNLNGELDSGGSYLVIDGDEVGTDRVQKPPFFYAFNTATIANGNHTLQIWASANNQIRVSEPIRMEISNSVMESAAVAPEKAGLQSIRSFGVGIAGNGVTMDGPAIQSIIDRHSDSKLYFPPGRYLLNNQGLNQSGLLFDNFSGSIFMAAGAEFVCNDSTAEAGQCLNIQRSNKASFLNVTVGYISPTSLPLPRSRCSPNNAILIEKSTDITLKEVVVETSPGSGVWITNSTNITIAGATVSKTSADGIHFENTLNASITDYTATTTGDDSLADSNLSVSNPNCGFLASRIHIRNSLARGIAVVGACRVNVNHFDVTDTIGSGISTTQDRSVQSRAPEHVRFSNGTVSSAGLHCGEVSTASDVAYDLIACKDAGNDGFFLYDGVAGASVTNSTVEKAKNVAFQAVNSSNIEMSNDTASDSGSHGFAMQSVTGGTLTNDRSERAGGLGFYHSGSSRLGEKNVVAYNSARSSDNHRAWWAENMKGPVEVEQLEVADDQEKATGFVIGDINNAPNATKVSGIVSQIGNGVLSIQAGGPQSVYSINPSLSNTNQPNCEKTKKGLMWFVSAGSNSKFQSCVEEAGTYRWK